MDTTTDPGLGIGMVVGPTLVAVAAGLMGVGIVEAITAAPTEWFPGFGWMGGGFLVGVAGSVWCLVASVVACAHHGDLSRRWGLGLCINLAALAVFALPIAVTPFA